MRTLTSGLWLDVGVWTGYARSMTVTQTILCIKWGTVFTAREVNTLYRACVAHTRGPVRFICLSDDFRGLDSGIQTRDIPDITLSDADIRRPGVWRKLALYHRDLHDLGRCLFIDLDMAVVGDLSPFFAVTQDVTFLNTGQDWRPVPKGTRKEAGTGVFSFDPEEQAPILAAFLKDPQGAMNRFTNEQDFASAHASGVAYWPEGRVLSFKRHLCYRYGLGLFRKPVAPAEAASIVAFHGHPRPSETRDRLIWGVPPHLHRGKVPWLEDYYAHYDA